MGILREGYAMTKLLIATLCTLTLAGTVAVRADSVDVRVYSESENDFISPDTGTIRPYDDYGNILDYQIRLGIENDESICGMSLGLRIWSDNVTWEWVAQDGGWGPGGINTGLAAVTVVAGSRMDPVTSVWDLTSLLVTERNMDGSGADSIMLGGVSMMTVLDAGPLESMLAIHFRINEFDESGWLCIDKAFIPPSGAWVFTDITGHGYPPPTNCPVCYSIGMPTSGNSADPALIPGEFALNQNFPNPFNPSTMITYTLGRETHVRICVYNILGQFLRTLVDDDIGAGTHRIIWDGTDSHGHQLASGIYFYRMTAGAYTSTRKMTLLR